MTVWAASLPEGVVNITSECSRKPTCWWQNILHKHEDGLLWADFDPLSNDIHELSNCEIGRHKVPAQGMTINLQLSPCRISNLLLLLFYSQNG